jgi:hypothetical protein
MLQEKEGNVWVETGRECEGRKKEILRGEERGENERGEK